MNEINIPSINLDTPIPFNLNLRGRGQPLEKLHLKKHTWSRLAEVRVWENHARWHGGVVGEVISYTARTVGLAPQTKRDKTFRVGNRAEMVKHVNEWIAKTVAAGLKKMAEEQSEQDENERRKREWIKEQIEKAGGVEARRQQILREAYGTAAREAIQYESADVFGAIMTALITRSPIALDIDTRDKIIARYEEHYKTSWHVKRYLDTHLQNLEDYLAKAETEEAA